MANIVSNLTHEWPLGDSDANTDIADPAGMFDGTLTGAGNTNAVGQRVSGPNAMAAYGQHLDGTDDWIDCGQHQGVQDGEPLTISMWVRPSSVITSPVLFAQLQELADVWSGNCLLGIVNRTIKWEIWQANGMESMGQTTTENVLSQDTWTHIAVTWDGYRDDRTHLKIYVDGVLADMTVSGSSTVAEPKVGTVSWSIGALLTNGITVANFPGDIADVRLYVRELAAEDVAELYAHAAPDPLDAQATRNAMDLDSTSMSVGTDSVGGMLTTVSDAIANAPDAETLIAGAVTSALSVLGFTAELAAQLALNVDAKVSEAGSGDPSTIAEAVADQTDIAAALTTISSNLDAPISGIEGASGFPTDLNDEAVPASRTFTLVRKAAGLIGDAAKTITVGPTGPTYAVDFRNDEAANQFIYTVDSVTRISGTSGGVVIGTPGKDHTKAKFTVRGVTPGTYVYRVAVTYYGSDPGSGDITIKVVA